MNEDKIERNIIRSFPLKFTEKNYEKCLTLICNELDIPTPLTLKYHFRYFDRFNSVRYVPAEFIETINFTSLLLENCPE